jgi:hypothetical protein
VIPRREILTLSQDHDENTRLKRSGVMPGKRNSLGCLFFLITCFLGISSGVKRENSNRRYVDFWFKYFLNR